MKKKLIIALAMIIITTLSATGCATGDGSNPAQETMVSENHISGDMSVMSDDTAVEDEIISANELPEESEGEEESGNMDETKPMAEYFHWEIVVTYKEPEKLIEVATKDGEILDIISLDNAQGLLKYESETLHHAFPIIYVKEHKLLIVTCYPEDTETYEGTTYYFRLNDRNELVYIDSEDSHNGWSRDSFEAESSSSEEDFLAYVNLTLNRYELTEDNFVWESPEEMKQEYVYCRLYYDPAMDKFFVFYNDFLPYYSKQEWQYEITDVITDKSDEVAIPPLFDDSCEISNYEERFCDIREETEYSEDGQLLSYELYGTIIEDWDCYNAGDEAFLTGSYYEYDEEGDIISWRKKRNMFFRGHVSSKSSYTCYFDKQGTCIAISYFMSHGYDDYYYVYLDDGDTPQYCVVFEDFWHLLSVYSY